MFRSVAKHSSPSHKKVGCAEISAYNNVFMELLVKRSHPGRENVIRSLARSVLILLAVLGAATAVRAQSYPLPATTPGTPVSCDPALPAAAVAACPFAPSPSTPGYQLPIKTFTG